MNISAKKCQELKENQTFTCTKKCEFTIFPFFAIGDKAFISVNTTAKKFPCFQCTGECHRSMNRIKCAKCSRWANPECINMTKSKAATITNFYCSTKCELSIFQFHSLVSTDFDKLVCHGKLEFRNYRKKWKAQKKNKGQIKTYSSEPATQCEYLEPDEVRNIVNNDCPNDLTIFHGNVCTSKNMEKVHELFQECNKLPDIIGITETRLKGDKIKSDIPDYEFEHHKSYTEAGGTGIYIANHLEYSRRNDLDMGIENCEDVWIEVHAPKSDIKTKFEGIQNLIVGMVYRHPGSRYEFFTEKLCNSIISLNQEKKRFCYNGGRQHKFA